MPHIIFLIGMLVAIPSMVICTITILTEIPLVGLGFDENPVWVSYASGALFFIGFYLMLKGLGMSMGRKSKEDSFDASV